MREMVPSSQRRHRLHGHEVPAVMTAVCLRLQQLVEERSDLEEATILFRILFRFTEHRPGAPDYPEPSWEVFESLLNGTIMEERR
jgi:hypothetical protein